MSILVFYCFALSFFSCSFKREAAKMHSYLGCLFLIHMILLAVARENNGWFLLKLNTSPSSSGGLLWTEVKAWSTIVQYCSTLVR
jgi:hypothetical protein